MKWQLIFLLSFFFSVIKAQKVTNKHFFSLEMNTQYYPEDTNIFGLNLSHYWHIYKFIHIGPGLGMQVWEKQSIMIPANVNLILGENGAKYSPFVHSHVGFATGIMGITIPQHGINGGIRFNSKLQFDIITKVGWQQYILDNETYDGVKLEVGFCFN